MVQRTKHLVDCFLSAIFIANSKKKRYFILTGVLWRFLHLIKQLFHEVAYVEPVGWCTEYNNVGVENGLVSCVYVILEVINWNIELTKQSSGVTVFLRRTVNRDCLFH